MSNNPDMFQQLTPNGGANISPWAYLSNAFAQFPHQQEALKQQKEQNAFNTQKQDLEIQQGRAQLQQDQMRAQQEQHTMAENRLNFLKPHLLSNSASAADPSTIQAVQGIYQQLGLPAPMTTVPAAGKQVIDVSSFKKPFSDIGEKEMSMLAQMNPEQRRGFLDQYAGVPPNLYTQGAWVDAKTQQAWARINQQGIHWEHMDETQAKNAETRKRLDDLKINDPYKYQLEEARIRDVEANAAGVGARIQLGYARLAETQKRDNAQIQHWSQATSGGHGNFQGLRLMKSTLDSVTRNAEQNDRDIASLTNELNNAATNGADMDSPQMQNLTALLAQKNQMKQQLDSDRENAVKALGQMESQSTGNYIQGSGGGSVTNVQNVGGGKPLGDAKGISDGTTANGGQFIARGGKWYKNTQ